MFSSFGQQQQQPSGGLFGAQPASTNPSPFGVAPPLPGGLFGAASTPASTSLFGAAAAPAAGLTTPQPSGLFGSTAPSPFGAAQQPQGVSPFGAPASSFGGNTAGGSTGMFGGATAAPGGMFGSSTPFGQAASNVSPFGAAQPAGAAASGTSGQKYQTTRDTELNMKLVSISAMDFYKNKSFEELRWEDHQAGRSGSGGAITAAPSSSAWGQPAPAAAPSGGLFGSTPSTGMFGSTQPAAQSGGLFGSTQPASTGGLFGAQAAAPGQTGGMFGSSQPAPGGGLFGTPAAQPTSGGLFGAQPATQPAISGGMFGSAATTSQPGITSGGLFGSTATTQPATSGGLFGSTATTQPAASGGLFGSTATTQPAASGGLFGSTTAQPATTGGLFGSTTAQPATTGGLFGASTTPAAPSGGLFGSTSTGAGSLFGAAPAATGIGGTTSLFGSTTSTTPATSGLFGSTTPATSGGGLFGSTPASTSGGGLFGTGSTTASSGGGLFGSTTTTTGGGGLFGASTGGGLFGSSSTAAPASSGGLGSLFGGQPAGQPAAAAALPAGGTGLGFAQGGLFGQVASPVGTPAPGPITPVPRPTGLVVPKPIDKDSLSAFLWKEKTSEATTPLIKKKPSAPPSPKTFVPEGIVSPKPAIAAIADDRVPSPLRLSTGGASILVKPKITYTTPTKARDSASGYIRNKAVLPVCSNHNLWLKPSIEAMSGMTESELSRIEHFQIGQYGVGSVTWPGITDVRFLVVDDNLILFKKGAVTLFPDEDMKPPVGTGLNKTAIIELFVKPKNYEVAKKYESRYVGEMKKMTEASGAEFLSYDLDAWRFRVEHFSTWGIDEMEWDRIDLGGNEKSRNDLSVFSRIEREVMTPTKRREDEDSSELETVEVDQSMDVVAPEVQRIYTRSDFVGALAVPPPTREELKAMGWDLKVCDLFLNQSFRAALKEDNSVVFPEHPVVYDSYKVSVAKMRVQKLNESDTMVLRYTVEKRTLCEMIDLMQHGSFEKSVFTLIDALIGSSSAEKSTIRFYPSGSPMSDHGDDKINTARFNEWLSRSNAEIIESRSNRTFSPAAALTSRHYHPTASDLLISSGNPRLALVAAAAANETSRQLMKPQLERVIADETVQDVYRILGGQLGDLSSSTAPDWRSQLALRYWYGEGDLTGFEAPEKSLEWKIIKTVVMGDSREIVQLIDTNEQVSLCLLLAVAITIQNLRSDIVSSSHLNHIVRSCANHLLEQQEWQWAVICLSLLPKSGSRDNMMFEIVAKNVGDDCSLIEEFRVVSEEKLVIARAMHEIGKGNISAAKDLLSRHGLKKLALKMTESLPVAVGRS